MLNRKYFKIILSLLIVIGIIYFKEVKTEYIDFFAEGKQGDLLKYLQDSNFTLLASVFFMFLQTVLANLKASNILFSIAEIYGYMLGTLVAWTGAMLGITLVFFLIRNLVHPITEKLINRKHYTTIGKIVNKYGHLMILVLNLSNFFYFDIIIYLAAISTMRFKKFFKAVAIGQFFSLFYMLYSNQNAIRVLEIEYLSYLIHYILPCLVIVFIISRIIKDRKIKE
ncbi:MAG: VTT domain-containing protein [Gemella sp.]|nr:VTT domain-containing protein [Gemella sp.]